VDLCHGIFMQFLHHKKLNFY